MTETGNRSSADRLDNRTTASRRPASAKTGASSADTAPGKLAGIAVRAKSRGEMVELEQAEITTDQGVAGDFRGKPGRRQVTVLASEDWQAACQALEKQLPWTTRRANLLVEGISLYQTTGSLLSIGDVVLQVTGETEPCWRMDEAAAGLCSALEPDWRGGVCCRVISGGSIASGTKLTLRRNAKTSQ